MLCICVCYLWCIKIFYVKKRESLTTWSWAREILVLPIQTTLSYNPSRKLHFSALHIRTAFQESARSRTVHCPGISHNPNSQTNRRKADCHNSNHPTLKKPSGPFSWHPPRVTTKIRKNQTPIKPPNPQRSLPKPMPRISKGELLCGRPSRSTPIMRKDIFEDLTGKKMA